uniref:Large ribosomal subunit protein bL20m n=1 Tax=Cercocebus atys TaxID=9531 RepID=A0A2K5NCD8_CERAT
TYSYWRVQEVLKHAKHFRRRSGLAVRAGTRAFVKCTKARNLKKRITRTLWINRITAATQSHGPTYPAFTGNLIKCQVERKVLADLAIYEPKTCKSLAALANRRRQEEFAAALGNGKEPEGIFFQNGAVPLRTVAVLITKRHRVICNLFDLYLCLSTIPVTGMREGPFSLGQSLTDDFRVSCE